MDVEYKDQVSVEHFFSKTNITSDFKRKIGIKLSIQCSLPSGRRLMAIFHIHLLIYFLECINSVLFIMLFVCIRWHGEA